MGSRFGSNGLLGGGHGKTLLSPEFLFGKEYRNEDGDRRFFQAQISFPTYGFGNYVWFPLVVLSYGIGF